MENKSNKKMSIGENKVFMGGVIIMLIVTLIVTLNDTLNLHVVVEKVNMFVEKDDKNIGLYCGITMIFLELLTLLFNKRNFVRRILSSNVFTDIVFIVATILLYNYMFSIEMLHININYEDIHGLLMWALILFMTPKGDKMVRMSISLYSIATIVLIGVSTLNLHIATIGQSTLFLDIEPLRVCVLVVFVVIKCVVLKISLHIVNWVWNKIGKRFAV